MSGRPVKLVNELWEHATRIVAPPELAIVIVSDADTVAFRHNCVDGIPALAAALHEMAGKLERGEAKTHLTAVPELK